MRKEKRDFIIATKLSLSLSVIFMLVYFWGIVVFFRNEQNSKIFIKNSLSASIYKRKSLYSLFPFIDETNINQFFAQNKAKKCFFINRSFVDGILESQLKHFAEIITNLNFLEGKNKPFVLFIGKIFIDYLTPYPFEFYFHIEKLTSFLEKNGIILAEAMIPNDNNLNCINARYIMDDLYDFSPNFNNTAIKNFFFNQLQPSFELRTERLVFDYKYIVLTKDLKQGLSNQLYALLSVINFNLSGVSIILPELISNIHHNNYMDFGDVFEVEFFIKGVKNITNSQILTNLPQEINKNEIYFVLAESVFINVAEYWFKKQRIINEYQYFSSFQLVSKLQEKIDRAVKEISGNYLCLHARIENDMPIIRNSLESLISKITNDKRFIRYKKVFLCTGLDISKKDQDFLENPQYIKQKYNLEIYITSEKTNNNLVDAAVDLHICKNSEVFIGCALSTFSLQIMILKNYQNVYRYCFAEKSKYLYCIL